MKKILRKILKYFLYFIGLLALIFIVCYLLSMGSQTVMKTVEQDPRHPYLVLDDAVLHVETFGDTANPVVIVIHGGPGDDFQYLLPLVGLSDDYFVVFYDQRGCGLSPRVDAEELTVENYFKDLDNLIDYFADTSGVYVIGHSWGAMLATGYIGKYPDKIKKAVLAEPGFLTPDFGKELQEKTNDFSMPFSLQAFYYLARAWFKSLHVHGPDPHARQDYFMQELVSSPIKQHPLSRYFCDADISNAALGTWRIGSLASKVIPESGKNEKGEFVFDFTIGLENYTNKVLFIAGSCNTLIGPEYQERQMQLYPNADLRVIDGAGHTMFGEKPEESMQVVREYFKSR
jgi:proline iminopeptidase